MSKEKTYPCGCSAIPAESVPDYCPDHGIPPEHTRSENCWCNPTVEPQPNGDHLVIHNRLDGRPGPHDCGNEIDPKCPRCNNLGGA